MPHIEPFPIVDLDALLELIAAGRITVAWKIPREAGHSVRLSVPMLHLLVDGGPVAESPLMDSFSQFIVDLVGETKHTPQTTLSANGTLSLSCCIRDQMLDIDFDFAESPSTPGSCHGGGGFVSASLTEFILKHARSG
ncbi:hypothetical protein LF1_54860 [Rubripirellula obstinata]|uniref:Uncharacterized protein n=1 Tax=Rubripirellula obstinata TaxID=406547 RepID=A0A5B1C8B4_9BACT|nr:hypothetical protein [Rubripirellula obstinata]KAA1257180.1 hypothetical protein LF1_55800 [Rubripirellula obstinata]KAA1257337.1 hypothetical protein LF1_54860 [Rubripirellula obstinata]